jgi:hypothetical protein
MSSRAVAIQRDLVLKHETGEECPVVVRLFVPHQIEQGDWQCDYEIRGGPVAHERYAVGIDSAQALTLVLGGLKNELAYIERKHKGHFFFLGEPGHEFT